MAAMADRESAAVLESAMAVAVLGPARPQVPGQAQDLDLELVLALAREKELGQVEVLLQARALASVAATPQEVPPESRNSKKPISRAC